MNEKTNKLQGIFTKMKKSLEENSSLEVFKKIDEIKSIGEPEVFKDNLFDILLHNFKEELINYLNIFFLMLKNLLFILVSHSLYKCEFGVKPLFLQT